MLRRSLAIARHEFRVLRSDKASLITLLGMPVVMMTFLRPVARLALQDEVAGANGSEFAVPGMAVLFAFFGVSFVGFMFFSEHRNNTWERLLASPARNVEILIGKLLPAAALGMTQQLALFGVGITLFQLHIRGAAVGLVFIMAAMVVSMVAIGVFLAAVLKNEQQLNVVANIGAMVLAGLSGALVPVTVLPGWAVAVAPVTPHFWAMRGHGAIILEGAGLEAVVAPVAMLLLIAAVFGAAALMRFRFDEPKVVSVA